MFLQKILPSKGVYCVAELVGNGKFRHYFRSSINAAWEKLEALDRAGKTCYISQASFDESKVSDAKAHNATLRNLSKTEYIQKKKVVRGQVNTLYLKNFFLDIDCGEKWPLKDQREGAVALKKFVVDTGLPFPAVVNSGNGLYAHWLIDEDVPSDKWGTVARILKKVVAEYSPKIGGDSSRTADSASVLRAPGTTNRKPGKSSKRVTILKDMDPVPFMVFVRHLVRAAKKRKIDIQKLSKPKPVSDINSEFFSGLEQSGAPKDANKIAESCAQLRKMKDSGGDIPEPHWYACLGVLIHCDSGEEYAHAWSKGHPNYDVGETVAKLEQWRSTGLGASTCSNFGNVNPPGCVGCRHNGVIKSPISLGRPDPVKKEVPSEQCTPPERFMRSKEGLFLEQEGRWEKFYDQDLYPVRLSFDESLGYEVMTIKHMLPFEGELECTIRSSLVNDQKLLINTLADNHIKVVGVREKKCMAAYLEGYAAKLQRQRRMSLLLCQMGWKRARSGKDIFVLGKKIFHESGKVDEASLAKNVPTAAEGYHTDGSLEKWSKATEILDAPGMEPYAFALLAGGFGAPLMKFTGFDGAMVSLVGKSGAGKTLMLNWIQSVWGRHDLLMMLRDDTKNALVSRLGVYGNLPLTIDEITNINGLDLSDLVYRITQGRDKARLTKDSQERKLLNRWNTLAVTSSNSSLIDKLSGTKHDAGAEINRIFEYDVPKNREFKGDVTTNLYWTVTNNYGLAGEEYAKWLIQNMDEVKATLPKIKALIDKEAETQGDERFWSAVMSVAIYGGLIAKKLGIIRFDIRRVLMWAVTTAVGMRGTKDEMVSDSVDILGQFIDDHAAARLLVRGGGRSSRGCTVIDEPKNSLVMRYEFEDGLLYISTAVFKKWIGRHFVSFSQVKRELEMHKILLGTKRKVLGAGTHFAGAQQQCLEIDLKNERLGVSAKEMVKAAEMLTTKYLNDEFKP